MSIFIGRRELPAIDPTLIERLAAFGVADLHESLAPARRKVSLMAPAMRAVVPGLQIVGQAVTAATAPGDNMILYAALDLIAPGQVMVMSNGGVAHGALFGDVSASFAMHLGVAGVIADGPVRDIAALREMRCPAWSTVVSPSHPDKNGPGSVNVPISCAGCIVNPGDVIVADDDAVLVLRPDEIAETLAAAEARAAREVGYRQRIAAGEHICDIVGIRGPLAAMSTGPGAGTGR